MPALVLKTTPLYALLSEFHDPPVEPAVFLDVPLSFTTPPLASIKLLSVRPWLLLAAAALPLAVMLTSSLPVDVLSLDALPMRALTVMPLSANKVRLASLATPLMFFLTIAALTTMLPSPALLAV